MTYLLDTNTVIAILTNRPVSVRARLHQVTAEDLPLLIPTVVLFELWFGVARSQHRAQNAERLRAFMSGNVMPLPFEDEDAAVAGDLRQELNRAGTPIGAYDLLIASQARRTGATLVTANVTEFRRVSSLVWEDWTQPG